MWRRFADRRSARRAQALRQAITGLPSATRRAMLDAVETEELIVGAYTDGEGGVCPMLAAHRRGARTGVGTFPRAWDAFARAVRPRRATQRELQILRALLEESFGGPVAGAQQLPSAPAGAKDVQLVAAHDVTPT